MRDSHVCRACAQDDAPRIGGVFEPVEAVFENGRITTAEYRVTVDGRTMSVLIVKENGQ